MIVLPSWRQQLAATRTLRHSYKLAKARRQAHAHDEQFQESALPGLLQERQA